MNLLNLSETRLIPKSLIIKNMQKRLDNSFYMISKRRNDLFGFAIIEILIFHFFEKQNNYISLIYRSFFGAVGVPMFLILSGIGLYFSFSKCSDLKTFYKKRIIRVIIPYLIVSGVHYFIMYICIYTEGLSVAELLKDIFFINLFAKGDKQFWYVGFILIMYCIFPLLYKIFESGKRNSIKLAIIILLVLSLTILLRIFLLKVFINNEIMLTRIPAFLIGVFLGKKVYDKERIKKIPFFAAAAGSITYFAIAIIKLFNIAELPANLIMRYGETIFGLLICMSLPAILELIDSKRLSSFLSFCGKISLELYLIHVSLRTIMIYLNISPLNPINYLGMIIISFLLAFCLQKLENFIIKKQKAIKS